MKDDNEVAGVGRRGRLRQRAVATLLLLVTTLALATMTACGGDNASQGGASADGSGGALPGGQNIEGKRVLFLDINAPAGDFHTTVNSGVDAAARLSGLSITKEYGGGDVTKERQLLETAIAENVDGIIVSVPSPALDNAVCAAEEAGIPVIAWNVNGVGDKGSRCVMAYVGQDFVDAGRVLGERLVEEGHIKAGDRVVCPVEFPESDYAARRAEGVNAGLRSVGARCDVINSTGDLARARTAIVQYLLGNRDTKAVVSLGGTPNSVAPDAAKEAGADDVVLAGFDSSPQVLQGIKDGRIVATVDQQLFSQGFYSVLQMALYMKYRLAPSDMATGGTGLIDRSNIDIVMSLSPEYR